MSSAPRDGRGQNSREVYAKIYGFCHATASLAHSRLPSASSRGHTAHKHRRPPLIMCHQLSCSWLQTNDRISIRSEMEAHSGNVSMPGAPPFARVTGVSSGGCAIRAFVNKFRKNSDWPIVEPEIYAETDNLGRPLMNSIWFYLFIV